MPISCWWSLDARLLARSRSLSGDCAFGRTGFSEVHLLDGGALTLEADAAPPPAVLDLLARHKASTGDIIVRARPHREPVAAAPDAFHGPAAIVTAPVAIAGTIVSLPFRVVEAVFPPHANDPRMLIGAPVHFAGQIAEFPFYVVNGAFGVPSTYYY
jgi:hypothetical protein